MTIYHQVCQEMRAVEAVATALVDLTQTQRERVLVMAIEMIDDPVDRDPPKAPELVKGNAS